MTTRGNYPSLSSADTTDHYIKINHYFPILTQLTIRGNVAIKFNCFDNLLKISKFSLNYTCSETLPLNIIFVCFRKKNHILIYQYKNKAIAFDSRLSRAKVR